MAPSLTYRRLRAPQLDGEMLLVPIWDECLSLARSNRNLLLDYDLRLQGKSFATLRSEARSDLGALANRYTESYSDHRHDTRIDQPVVMSGHQPQLFHPGVWAKNFVAERLAKAVSGVAVHVIIDNDILRHHAIRVPTGKLDSPDVVSEPFDQFCEPQPYEFRRVRDRDVLDSFAERVQARLTHIVADPLVSKLWPEVRRAVELGNPLGHAFAQARHALERSWGLDTLELPLSWLCETNVFRWFAADLLLRGSEVRAHTNRRLSEYRSVHRLRSPAQPLPDLRQDGEWTEAPFWILDQRSLSRRALWWQRRGTDIQFCDGARASWTLQAAEHRAETLVEQLASLAARELYLRPRALTTTMFLRLFLCDCFIHGIGGAKYDQITDLLIFDLFAKEAPRLIAFSQTTLLPVVGGPTVSVGEISAKKHRLREMYFHPERFLDPETRKQDQVSMLEKTKEKWTQLCLPRGQRGERHRSIEAANAELRRFLAEKTQIQQEVLRELEQLLPASRVWASREWSFCLFPEELLRARLLDLDFATT